MRRVNSSAGWMSDATKCDASECRIESLAHAKQDCSNWLVHNDAKFELASLFFCFKDKKKKNKNNLSLSASASCSGSVEHGGGHLCVPFASVHVKLSED